MNCETCRFWSRLGGEDIGVCTRIRVGCLTEELTGSQLLFVPESTEEAAEYEAFYTPEAFGCNEHQPTLESITVQNPAMRPPVIYADPNDPALQDRREEMRREYEANPTPEEE